MTSILHEKCFCCDGEGVYRPHLKDLRNSTVDLLNQGKIPNWLNYIIVCGACHGRGMWKVLSEGAIHDNH